jgi:phospholipid/cholesterol/gamma-HCH transport system substrate-binding protein
MRLLPVMDTLALTLEDVRRVAKQANDGQGTIGLLLNNPDLYKSLDDAAAKLNRTLIELQALIEQMRAEGVIIQF